ELLRPEEPEGLVRHVLIGQFLQHVPGARSPQADAAGATGDVPDVHRVVGVLAQPGDVARPVAADLEEVFPQPGDGDVGADAAVVVQHQGVGDVTGCAVQLVRGQALQQ